MWALGKFRREPGKVLRVGSIFVFGGSFLGVPPSFPVVFSWGLAGWTQIYQQSPGRNHAKLPLQPMYLWCFM